MHDLIRFLRTQYAEDAHAARCALAERQSGREARYPYPDRVGVVIHNQRQDAAHVLADIEAKVHLIGEILAYEARIDGEWGCCHTEDAIAAGFCPERPVEHTRALQLLALPYVDRPGYREEWRPADDGHEWVSIRTLGEPRERHLCHCGAHRTVHDVEADRG